MPPDVLITISGLVGSGKSTTASKLQALATARGRVAVCLRFQTLPCFGLFRSRAKAPGANAAGAQPPTGPVRGRGYRRTRLTAARCAVYGLRILSFRLYRLSWRDDQVRILDRYFYDLFAHYTLRTRLERLYVGALRKLMPRPDLAILVSASPETIAARRPAYAPEYVSELSDSYRDIRQWFPELLELQTERGHAALEQLEADLLILLERRR